MCTDATGHSAHRLQGYVSYSYEDRERVERLLRHLSPLEQMFDVSLRSDRCITAGSQWDDGIATAIGQADIFILCMSADYLASKYLYYREIPAIRQRQAASHVLVIPVILRACSWWGFVGDFQVAPTRNRRVKPIAEWRPQANGYRAAAEQIIDAIRLHFAFAATGSQINALRPNRKTRRSGPVTLPGPHRVSPEDVDRAVETVIARRAAGRDV